MITFNDRFAVRLDTLNTDQRGQLFLKMRRVMRGSPIGGSPMYHKYLVVGSDAYIYTNRTPHTAKRINIRTIKRIFQIGE